MAGGDLKSFVNFLVLGLSGYMTARGLTSLFKTSLIDSLAMDLSAIGGQGIPHVISIVTSLPLESLWLSTGLIVASLLIFYCFRDKAFRRSRRDVIAGVCIGFSVDAAILITQNIFNTANIKYVD
jgi:hypothetical protein